jgi:hypothetical protein
VRLSDSEVLAWAAVAQRILVTHDLQTIPSFAYERVRAGQSFPGVFLVPNAMPVGQVIAELVLLIASTDPSEWENRVLYLPL